MKIRFNKFISAFLVICILALTLIIPSTIAANGVKELLWNFEDGTIGTWRNYQYTANPVELSVGKAESTALKFPYSWTSDSAYDWSVAPQISSSQDSSLIVGDFEYLLYDFYIEQEKYTTGGFEIFAILNSPQYSNWFMMPADKFTITSMTVLDNGFLKYSACVPLINTDGVSIKSSDNIGQLAFTIIGANTDYNGNLYFDNIRFVSHDTLFPNNPKAFSLESVEIENLYTPLGEPITYTATPKDAYGDIVYKWIILKDGKLIATSEIQAENSFDFTPYSYGTYLINVYAIDSIGNMAKKNVSLFIRDPAIKADKFIAITFDDGPFSTTDSLLQVLEEKDVHATFFLTGTSAQYRKNTIQSIHDKGHEIGNHTWSHQYLTSLTDTQVLTEINDLNDLIISVIGEKPKYVRAPYLSHNQHIRTIADMPFIDCSIDSRDWTGISTDEIVSNVVSNAKDGDIILLHEANATTREAVPVIINQLRAKGFEIGSVGELFKEKGITVQSGQAYSSIK